MTSATQIDDQRASDALDEEVFENDTVGQFMDREFITISPDLTIGQATTYLRKIENEGQHNTTEFVYVVEEYGNLVGLISYHRLILSDKTQKVGEVMIPDENLQTVDVHDDQEVVAKILDEHKLFTIPVLDGGKMVGILLADDVLEIVEDEDDEDIAKQSAQQALDKPYLETSSWGLWKKRVGWLLLLFVAEFFTSSILQSFEDELERCIALSFFIPLLVSVGGNSASQIVGTLIRVMETENVSLRHIFKVVRKELTTASMLGIIMAVVGFFRAWTLGVGMQIMITVGLTVFIIMLWAALMAAVLPLFLKKIKIDPAVVSSALLATLIDATGLIIFLMMARIFVF